MTAPELQQEASQALASGTQQKRMNEARSAIRRQEEQINALRCENDRLRDESRSNPKVCLTVQSARAHKYSVVTKGSMCSAHSARHLDSELPEHTARRAAVANACVQNITPAILQDLSNEKHHGTPHAICPDLWAQLRVRPLHRTASGCRPEPCKSDGIIARFAQAGQLLLCGNWTLQQHPAVNALTVNTRLDASTGRCPLQELPDLVNSAFTDLKISYYRDCTQAILGTEASV
jgi:hypothetical protein